MALPPLPKELGNASLDIHTLFLYLQRVRDQFSDSVTTTVVESTFSDEDAQDAVGIIGQDSNTVEFNYDDATPRMTWDVKENSSIQKVEVAKDSALVGTRKRLNFLQKSHNQLTFTDDSAGEEVELSINPFPTRLVAVGEDTSLLDTHSLVISRYFKVQGTLRLNGDSILQVL